ncbi:DUF3040 domain-containing protein [Streptomyces marokkonensis]|uniref:DUF3040 domain-containing protein n=1 Tax=Streptomyces marokkonensis TaxID=324855 RepID=UPI0011F3CFFF|nr:DUF3040 domain-containing protein [Streptomyces marokkonensis]
MPQSNDDRLVGPAAPLEHEDPRRARPPSAGQPARPRGYRRAGAWWALVIGVTMLVAGVIVPDGLLIAAGLVLSGIAVQLLDPDRRPARAARDAPDTTRRPGRAKPPRAPCRRSEATPLPCEE